jgi:Ca2+-binding RTX toxin-like protein
VPTSWWFEYGATTTYGKRTPTRSAGNGRVQAAVSESVTGLAGGSTVQFRLVVSSDAGTAVGRNGSVRVGAAPAAATRGVARVTTSSAIATGTVVTNGLVTSWWVEHGRTTAYGSRTATFRLSAPGATSVRALLSGLGQGTIVHYRVVAQNAAGTAVGSDRAFVTARLPRTPAGDIVRCTVTGTTGNDLLRGTPGRDVVCGLEGNDVIRSLGGNDVVYGGPGNDRIETAAGNDVVFAGEGNDTLDGGTGNDALDGGAGRDRIIAGPGRDTMVGGSGTNTANGGPGLDCAVTRGGRTTLVSAGVCPKRR